jgi:medium-chain acyl-[acyl-carrier-protein] hydrolase
MSELSLSNPWIVCRKSRPRATVRLFCLPYAGGSAAIFRNWSRSLPGFIEVCPIQLPGRGERFGEQPFTSMNLLVDAIEPAIVSWLDKPFAFFGHSMGARIAYELSHKLRSGRRLEPKHLFVSARSAPQLAIDTPLTFNLPERDFLDGIRRLNGTPRELLANPELMEMMLPLLRADFELIETVPYLERPHLTCPVTALGGTADQDVLPAHLEAWGELSSGKFRMRMFPGDHFFLGTHESEVVQVIAEQLAAQEAIA